MISSTFRKTQTVIFYEDENKDELKNTLSVGNEAEASGKCVF